MNLVYHSAITKLHQTWASTFYQMAKLRDNLAYAKSEYNSLLDAQNPGLSYNLTFKPVDDFMLL